MTPTLETVDGVPYLGGPHCGSTHRIPPGDRYPELVDRVHIHGGQSRTYQYALTRFVRRCATHHGCAHTPPAVVHVYRIVREEPAP